MTTANNIRIAPAEQSQELDFAAQLEKRLDARLSKLSKDNATVVVRRHFPLLQKYREAGVGWDVIAEEMTTLGCTVTARSLATVFSRSKKYFEKQGALAENVISIAPAAAKQKPSPAPEPEPTSAPVPAPAARIEREQQEVAATQVAVSEPSSVKQPQPQPAARKPLPTTTTSATDAGHVNPHFAKIWADRAILQKPVDRLCEEIPAVDREYPGLLKLRFWTDSSGEKWDVATQRPPEGMLDSDQRRFLASKSQYQLAKYKLFETWGIVKINDKEVIRRYELAERLRKELVFDLDDLIKKHLD